MGKKQLSIRGVKRNNLSSESILISSYSPSKRGKTRYSKCQLCFLKQFERNTIDT